MARARAAEHQRSRSKTALIEEIAQGISRFQEVLAAINDISQEGFPYRDAAQSKAELQFRECLRQTFGERSHEFQTYRNFKIRTAAKAEVTQTISVIRDLMHTLEDRKLELQGLKPPPKADPATESLSGNPASLVSGSPVTSCTTPQTNSPVTVAVAMTTSVGPSSAPLIPQPQTSRPESVNAPEQSPIPASTLDPTPPTPTLTPIPVVSQPPPLSGAASILSPSPISSVQPSSSPIDSPVEITQVSPSPATPISSSVPPQPPINTLTPVVNDQSMSAGIPPTVVRAPQDPPVDMPVVNPSRALSVESVHDSALGEDALRLVRKVCHRFHTIARQLRLRRDYRPTLEVDDDYDLQDLLCALLKVEFDEVATEEWTPPYTGGAPRTTLLVNRDQIAVVSKKTRPGLTTKDLADQVAADSAYYRAQGRCSTLVCFVYDPEGRIGSPKRLETTLTSVSEHCRIEVLVAPK